MLPQCMLICHWEGKFFPPFFVTPIFSITSLTILFDILPATMRSHRCFREKPFSGGNITFRKWVRVGFCTPNFTRKTRIAYLVQYSSFVCLAKLPFYVCLYLNQWKFDISYEPFIYMLLFLILYQRSGPLFLCTFQFNCYFRDLPIPNTVSWCSSTGVSDPWTTYIKILRTSSWFVVTIIKK